MDSDRSEHAVDIRMAALRAKEAGRGREAESPGQIPTKGWRDVVLRTWKHLLADRAGVAAAAATFYVLLAFVPALTAFVSLYGLLFDLSEIQGHVARLSAVIPGAGIEIIENELKRLSQRRTDQLGAGLVIGLGIAFWSASNAIKSMFHAMNVAYDEGEKRSFFSLFLLSLLFAWGTFVFTVMVVNVFVVLPVFLSSVGLGKLAEALLVVLPPLFLFLVINVLIALLYRYGPSRRPPKWRWVTWGSMAASLVWLLASSAFAFYLANFNSYDRTYGSMGALIGFMMWIYISCYIIILGAELNAEIEHQTAKDSTIGPDRPLGSRKAYVADTLGAKQ